MTVAAAILAAGQSSRFEDGHKLLFEIDGIPIVRHVCSALAASELDEILLVTSDDAIAAAAGPGRWRTIKNSRAHEGLSTSLNAALRNVASNADGVLLTLADMPGVTPVLVNALLSTFESNNNRIVFPETAEGQRGPPIIWPKSLFPELMRVTGDTGGKAVLAAHKDLWLPVRWENANAFADIDTRADAVSFRQNQSTKPRR